MEDLLTLGLLDKSLKEVCDRFYHKLTLFYIISGGACAEKILKDKKYDGIVGVACGMELKMGLGLLRKLGIPGQGIFLTKNGCSNTSPSLQNPAKIL